MALLNSLNLNAFLRIIEFTPWTNWKHFSLILSDLASAVKLSHAASNFYYKLKSRFSTLWMHSSSSSHKSLKFTFVVNIKLYVQFVPFWLMALFCLPIMRGQCIVANCHYREFEQISHSITWSINLPPKLAPITYLPDQFLVLYLETR